VWGAMLEKFNELKPKPQNVAELKKATRYTTADITLETERVPPWNKGIQRLSRRNEFRRDRL